MRRVGSIDKTEILIRQNDPKKHHTVPKTYLKHFAYPSARDKKKQLVCVYDKKEGTFNQQPINKSSVIKHFYTRDGKDNSIEHWLANTIDANYNRCISLIKNRIDVAGDIHINHLTDLADFIGCLTLRTEPFRQAHDKAYLVAAKDDIDKLQRKEWDTSIYEKGVDAEELANCNLSISVPQEFSINYMKDNYGEASKEFLLKKWIFLYSPNSSFITTDNPVTPEARIGELSTGLRDFDDFNQIIPLTSKIALFLCEKRANRPRDKYYISKVSRKQVRAINKRLLALSGRFVYADNEASIRRLI